MPKLCVIDFYWKVETAMFSLEASRDSKFEILRQQALDGIQKIWISSIRSSHDNAKFQTDYNQTICTGNFSSKSSIKSY